MNAILTPTKGTRLEVELSMMESLKTVSILVILIFSNFVSSWCKADLLSSVETQGLSFISQDYENTKSSNFGFFGATLRSVKSENDAFKMNLTGMYAVGNPVLSYLNVREIYFTYDIDSTSRLHIGRKINIWSNVDDKWNLGFFQPQFRWNSLSPENQGLTGFFWEKTMQSFDFMLFASPIFIPDQGPGYELKEGQFESNNPWFQAPPQNVLFQNQLLPIDYQIQNPNISDIVFQPNFGLQVKYGESRGLFAHLSGFYKPSHQVAFGYKGILVTDRVRVTVQPKTYYENLVSADFGYRQDWGSIDLSVLYLRPTNPDFDSTYNRPIISESTTFGPHVSYKLNDYFNFDVSGLSVSGPDITEVGIDANPAREPLTTKFLYTSAYEVSLKYRETFRNTIRITSELIWRQAEKNSLKILKSNNIIDLKGPWKFLFHFILVETSDESTSLSNYRNLDQLWIGASYDF